MDGILTKIKNIKTGEIKFFSGAMSANKFIRNNVLENKKRSDWVVLPNG